MQKESLEERKRGRKTQPQKIVDELDASTTTQVLTFIIDCRATENGLETRQIYLGNDVTTRNWIMLPVFTRYCACFSGEELEYRMNPLHNQQL